MFLFDLGLQLQGDGTQKGFADEVGCDQYQISACVTGRAYPTPDQIRRFAKVLGIPPNKVMARVPSLAEIAAITPVAVDPAEEAERKNERARV